MSVKIKMTPFVWGLTFMFGACEFLRSQQNLPGWVYITAGCFCAGCAAVGLLKAEKQKEG